MNTPTNEPAKQEHPSYSLDGEHFYVEWSAFAAKAEEAGLQPGDRYYKAMCTCLEGADVCTSDEVYGLLEELDTRLFDTIGTDGEAPLAYPSDAVEELRKLIVGWVDANTNIGENYIFTGELVTAVLTPEEVTW